jgi:hypothetical protein
MDTVKSLFDELFVFFQKHKSEWKWFFDKYIPNKFIVLEEAINDKKLDLVDDALNKAWFSLPDSKFNIIVMPDGWDSFLEALERIGDYRYKVKKLKKLLNKSEV